MIRIQKEMTTRVKCAFREYSETKWSKSGRMEHITTIKKIKYEGFRIELYILLYTLVIDPILNPYFQLFFHVRLLGLG